MVLVTVLNPDEIFLYNGPIEEAIKFEKKRIRKILYKLSKESNKKQYTF